MGGGRSSDASWRIFRPILAPATTYVFREEEAMVKENMGGDVVRFAERDQW